jgi:predicted AAA+ superfamily ATPase|tara:strand:- start:510 stop:773 length:264 start_codon:yes stop_codon:yes gene_type:complete
MLEGEYIELTNQLKKKFDENEATVNKLKAILDEVRKSIFCFYGLARALDNLIDDDDDAILEVKTISSILRHELSDSVNKMICPINNH